jgi:uncharacterized protein (DUF2336 family)
MIVRQFLHWVRTAPAGVRAEATGALARAFLYSDLSAEDRAAAEGAMITLTDDPSPLVRHALAEALAASPDAPHAVIHALASDQSDIAGMILARSPLFIDAELVDLAAIGGCPQQAATAARAPLQCAVAAAIAEVGTAEACLIAIENPHADIAPSSIDRIVERFGHLGAIREALFARPNLPLAARQALVRLLSQRLADFVADRAWLARERACEVMREACEKAAVTIAALGEDARPLIRHLRVSGQLTAGLVLRALLSGNIAMFEDALAELAELPLARVRALVHDRGSAGFRAVFDKAGLPGSTYVAFREALAAIREAEGSGEFFGAGGSEIGASGGASRLKRRMVERVLTSCERADLGDIEPLLILLRRFAAEAAREDARIYCEELVGETELAELEHAA